MADELEQILAQIEEEKARIAEMESVETPTTPDMSADTSLPGLLAGIATGGAALAGESELPSANTTGRVASAMLGGIVPSVIAPPLAPFLSPITATAGGQGWDAFTRSVTGEEKPVEQILIDSLDETKNNAIAQGVLSGGAAALKAGIRGVNSKFGSTARTARESQSPEAFGAMIGQGIQQTNVSEGGAKMLAKQMDNLVESNAILGKEFDAATGKFVGNVGKETLEQMRDRLGKETLDKIASARAELFKQLDDGVSASKGVAIQGKHVDTTVSDEILARLELSGENASLVNELRALQRRFINDIGQNTSFSNAQKLLTDQYKKIAELGKYDPAALAQQPASAAANNIYVKNFRSALAESLRKTIQQRADEVGEIVGARAPNGELNSQYIDRLNDTYGAISTLADDLNSFISRQIGGTGNRPAGSFVQSDISRIDPKAPVQSGWRSLLGQPLENYRRGQIYNQLDKKIPDQLRAFVTARTQGPPTIPDGSGFIDPLTTLGVTGMFGAMARPQPSLMERDIDSLPTEEEILQKLPLDVAQSVSMQLSRAEQMRDPVAMKKVMGLVVSQFPEVGDAYAPPMSMAKSEYGGVVADPADKYILKMKLTGAIRAGAESSIEAAKFVSNLNADIPFKKVPKSIRAQDVGVPDPMPVEPNPFFNLG